jgi:hypothetical protein
MRIVAFFNVRRFVPIDTNRHIGAVLRAARARAIIVARAVAT